MLWGFGSLGIVQAFLIQQLVITVSTFFLTLKKLGLAFTSFGYIIRIIREGLINTPAKPFKDVNPKSQHCSTNRFGDIKR